jgi:hypothetical protein
LLTCWLAIPETTGTHTAHVCMDSVHGRHIKEETM